MKYERVYDEFNRLQCRGCKLFFDQTNYYQHDAPKGRFRNQADNYCKTCQRDSEVAKISRAHAKEKYAADPAFRAAKIKSSIANYEKNKVAIQARRRAMWIAKKYVTADKYPSRPAKIAPV